MKIANNVTELVGNTPLVQLNRVNRLRRHHRGQAGIFQPRP
jgi:cysteine synthase